MLHNTVNLNYQLCLSGDICRACVGVRNFEQIWSLISSKFRYYSIHAAVVCLIILFIYLFKFLSCVELTSCLGGLLLPCFVLFFIFLLMNERVFPIKKKTLSHIIDSFSILYEFLFFSFSFNC